MASATIPPGQPGIPPFFDTWALQRSDIVESPNVSPACADHVSFSQVAINMPVSKMPVTTETAPQKPGSIYGSAGWYRSNPSQLEPPRSISEGTLDSKPIESPPSEQPSVLKPSRSRSSSTSSKVLNLFKLPELRIQSKVVKVSDPSAQETNTANVRRTSKKKGHKLRRSWFSASSEGSSADPPSNPTSSADHDQQPRATLLPPAKVDGLDSLPPDGTKRFSTSGLRRSSGMEVVYTHTKRFFKSFGRRPSQDASDPELPLARTRTRELLERVSSALAHQTKSSRSPAAISTNHASTWSLHSRKSPADSAAAHSSRPAVSSSSSIRVLKMGKQPINTPDSEAMYGGPEGKDYFKVEISDPNGPTFLPSEARRIGTPPLPSIGNRRGFFFDFNAPVTDESPSDGVGTPREVTSSGRIPTMATRRNLGHNDWYSVQLEMEDAREAVEQFELDVPDHLPGSPLCPRSPMHKSGGKGTCVYHGRN